MSLQRQRFAETQLLDRRTRRLLHDEVLPKVHAALLSLSGAGGEAVAEASEGLADAHRQVADLLREMPWTVAPEVARFGLVGALKELVEVEMPAAFDGVGWSLDAGFDKQARALPPLVAEVVFAAAREAIRNASRYGRNPAEPHPLHLFVEMESSCGLSIAVEDDGVGLGSAGAVFSGSGQGLALHSTMMAVVGGTLSVEGAPAAGTRVTLVLPSETFIQEAGDASLPGGTV